MKAVCRIRTYISWTLSRRISIMLRRHVLHESVLDRWQSVNICHRCSHWQKDDVERMVRDDCTTVVELKTFSFQIMAAWRLTPSSSASNMQSIEIKSADPVRDAIICIVDPKILSFHLKAHAPSTYTRSAHEVQVHEQGHCPGRLVHADGAVAAVLWPLTRSLAGWDARRAFDPRRAAARTHKSRTLCPRRLDTQRFMNERQCRLPAALAYDCTRPSGPTAGAEIIDIQITRDVIKLKMHAPDAFYTRWCALE